MILALWLLWLFLHWQSAVIALAILVAVAALAPEG
jgi:hypothetical protein